MADAHSTRRPFSETLSPKRIASFWSKVRKDSDGCWRWTACQVRGYGCFPTFKGQTAKAHRIAWELHHGAAISSDLTIDHLCRVLVCVNPAHLEPVTNKENVLRGEGYTAAKARQTHCKRGHALTPENIIPDYRGRGRGKCRICVPFYNQHLRPGRGASRE